MKFGVAKKIRGALVATQDQHKNLNLQEPNKDSIVEVRVAIFVAKSKAPSALRFPHWVQSCETNLTPSDAPTSAQRSNLRQKTMHLQERKVVTF